MENEKCEGHNDHLMYMLVPKALLLATVMGIGACVRHRRHRHLHDGPAKHDGHCGCQHPRQRGSGDPEHHHDGPDHAPHQMEHREGPGHLPPRPQQGPVEILELRFASGEIDEDEFRRRLSVLHENTR